MPTEPDYERKERKGDSESPVNPKVFGNLEAIGCSYPRHDVISTCAFTGAYNTWKRYVYGNSGVWDSTLHAYPLFGVD